MADSENGKIIRFLEAALLLSAFLFGGFYEFAACIMTILLLAGFVIFLKKNKKTEICGTLPFYTVLIFLAGSLISVFAAVDPGMAFVGFLKYLPLLPAVLLISGQKTESREKVICTIPYINAGILCISLFSLMIPGMSEHFFMSERLGGTFQYSNTMALLFLIGFYVLEEKEKLSVQTAVLLIVQLAGILLTGSRSVFVFMVVFVIISLFRNKSYRLFLVGLMGAAVLIGILVVSLTGNMQNIGRFLTISWNNSTLLGRLLYWKDALPLILTHPFGIGFMGYYYIQGQIQTGVYSTMFLHNDLLQLILDLGWIPAAAAVWMVIRSLRSKENSRFLKGILLIISLHSLFDFDLQYFCMQFIFLLSADYGKIGKKSVVLGTTAKKVIFGITGFLMILSLWFLFPFIAEYKGAHKMAVKLYPYYTTSNLELLRQSASKEEGEALADRVLRQNQHCSLAYDAKALAELVNGNFDEVIRNKKLAIENNPYELYEYTDYIGLLDEIMRQCVEQKREEDIKKYRECITEVPELLQKVKDRTSELGLKIRDKPDLELPEEYENYIQAVQ